MLELQGAVLRSGCSQHVFLALSNQTGALECSRPLQRQLRASVFCGRWGAGRTSWLCVPHSASQAPSAGGHLERGRGARSVCSCGSSLPRGWSVALELEADLVLGPLERNHWYKPRLGPAASGAACRGHRGSKGFTDQEVTRSKTQ